MNPREAEVGELSTESSPEWLLLPESDLLGTRLSPFRPEADPDELELLLVVVVVVVVVVSELVAGPLVCRVRKGETGEPRSSSLKSGLFVLLLSQVKESRNRSVSVSSPSSDMGFPECDIFKQKSRT